MRAEQVRKAFEDPGPYLRRRYRVRWRVDAVEQFIGDRRFERALDVGCGDGSLSLPFLDKIGHLTLLDSSQAMLDAARRRAPDAELERIDFTLSDVDSLSVQEGSLDLLLCVGLLAHVDDPDALLSRVAPLVKPGGLFIVEHTDALHPAGWAIVQFMRWRSRWSDKHYPVNFLAAPRLLSRCNELGFRCLGEYRFGLPFRLDRVVEDERLYHLGRFIFGDTKTNANRWLGCERMYCLVKS